MSQQLSFEDNYYAYTNGKINTPTFFQNLASHFSQPRYENVTVQTTEPITLDALSLAIKDCVTDENFQPIPSKLDTIQAYGEKIT